MQLTEFKGLITKNTFAQYHLFEIQREIPSKYNVNIHEFKYAIQG